MDLNLFYLIKTEKLPKLNAIPKKEITLCKHFESKADNVE